MEDRHTDRITAAEEEAEDSALHHYLERSGYTAAIPPPPDLTTRVLAHLPDQPPVAAARAQRRRYRLQQLVGSLVLLGVVAFTIVGVWGIFGSSNGPSQLAGGLTTTLGQLLLVLVLAAKPVVYLFLAPGLPLLATGVLVCIGMTWLWWYLVRHVPVSGYA